jgi:hypothetical protein
MINAAFIGLDERIKDGRITKQNPRGLFLHGLSKVENGSIRESIYMHAGIKKKLLLKVILLYLNLLNMFLEVYVMRKKLGYITQVNG